MNIYNIGIIFADSGIGIPANEYEHVVERFVRLDNTRQTQGNGLGLSLVKAVCELHQGTLQFKAAHTGLGIVVTMCFPRGKGATPLRKTT